MINPIEDLPLGDSELQVGWSPDRYRAQRSGDCGSGPCAQSATMLQSCLIIPSYLSGRSQPRGFASCSNVRVMHEGFRPGEPQLIAWPHGLAASSQFGTASLSRPGKSGQITGDEHPIALRALQTRTIIEVSSYSAPKTPSPIMPRRVRPSLPPLVPPGLSHDQCLMYLEARVGWTHRQALMVFAGIGGVTYEKNRGKAAHFPRYSARTLCAGLGVGRVQRARGGDQLAVAVLWQCVVPAVGAP